MKSTDAPVVVEQEYKVPIEKLWGALTEKEQMQQWFFTEIEEFKPAVGFETQFTIEHDGRTYVHLWKVIDVIENEKIVYDWRYQDCPGQGIVTWELSPTAAGSKSKLTNEIVESFPQDDPAFKRESCEAGWNYFLNEQLADYFE